MRSVADLTPTSCGFVLVFDWVRVAISSLLALVCATTVAHATPYETFVDVDNEGDLQDLLAAGTITDETYSELLELLSRGVDLTNGDRNELYTLPNLTYEDVDAILAYRNLNRGRIRDPGELVAAGALSEEKLLAIAAFLIVRQPGESPLAATGWVRAMVRAAPHDFNPYEPQDPFLPPLGLRARVRALQHLTAGVAITTTRLQIGDPVYDPTRDALIAEQRSYQVHAPKAYIKYEDGNVAAVAGSYRIGFGQRLVFDNSSAYSPNGIYNDDQLFFSGDLATACKESAGELTTSPCLGPKRYEYITPDFQWRDGLFGAAIGAKRIELATGWLQGFAFGSASRRSIYQYEIVDRGKCTDPHDDEADGGVCAAPNVYVERDNPLETTSRHSYATLPNVFQERLVGGNITYFADRRNSVGITGYGAQTVDLLDGIDLDFQEWSRYPFGKKFGAAGANFAYGRGWLDIFGEAAVSFDAMGEQDPALTSARGGGGPAAILRATATRKREELEVVLRYLSTDFLNPYGRPIAQSDEFEGQRARDEAGGRVRYIRTDKELQIRALVDMWVNPSAEPIIGKDGRVIKAGPKIDTYVRVNVKTSPVLWLGLWERFQDKNVTASGHDQCFELSNENDESGEPIPCGGMQLSTIARATYEPDKKVSATLQLQHQLLDDNTQMELEKKFRQDFAVWAVGYFRPNPDVRIRARLRYLDEAIHDNTYLERSVAGLVDVAMRARERDTVRIRIDGKKWLDKRDTTLLRVPDPELSIWLFYEARL